MNYNWLIPSLLISYLGNDRVPKSLFTGKTPSIDNSSLSNTNFIPFHFEPPLSAPHDLDYLSTLFTNFFLPNFNFLISPLATKLSLLVLTALGDDFQKAELLRLLETPPLLNSTELLNQAANLRHYFTTSTKSELHRFNVYSLIFVDRQLFYYDYDYKLAETLESSGLLSLGFYPLKSATAGGSTLFESWRQFEAFKRTQFPKLHLHHHFYQQLKLPEMNTLTTLTSFSQQWPLPFTVFDASETSLPFYHNPNKFSRPPFLHRVLHNSRYLHYFNASFVEIPFEKDELSLNSFFMIIALPDQNSSLSALLQSLSQYRALSREVLPHLQPTPVNLTLPAFQLTSTNLDLVNDLLSSSSLSPKQSLNLNSLFPSISTSLRSVQQLSSLSLTSTGVCTSTSDDHDLLPPQLQPIYVHAEVSVLVDRPFFFLITEKIAADGTAGGNGNILEIPYAGTVYNL